jgi:hypothetical protein
MSNAMDDLAEITRARQEREREELESRHDIEYILFLATNRTPDYDYLFHAAKRLGHVTVEENGRPVGTITYVPGLYSIMSPVMGPDDSQEG